jgi:hypothetical protein
MTAPQSINTETKRVEKQGDATHRRRNSHAPHGNQKKPEEFFTYPSKS